MVDKLQTAIENLFPPLPLPQATCHLGIFTRCHIWDEPDVPDHPRGLPPNKHCFPGCICLQICARLRSSGRVTIQSILFSRFVSKEAISSASSTLSGARLLKM